MCSVPISMHNWSLDFNATLRRSNSQVLVASLAMKGPTFGFAAMTLTMTMTMALTMTMSMALTMALTMFMSMTMILILNLTVVVSHHTRNHQDNYPEAGHRRAHLVRRSCWLGG